jgi:hypothetical protein
MITRFDNFLNEGITDIVYHRTYTDPLISILKSGKILLSTSVGGGGADIYSKKPYFLSLSRTKFLNVGYGKNYPVTIEFDGTQLRTKYKGKAIDYWSPFYKEKDRDRGKRTDYEFEDRIFSDTPYLENFDKYIKNIDIVVPDSTDVRAAENWKKRNINILNSQILKIKNINSPLLNKIRIFTSEKDFHKGKNWIPIEKYNPIVEGDVDQYEHSPSFEYRALKKIILILLIGDKNINNNEYVENFIKKYFDKFIKMGSAKLKNIDDQEIRSMRYDIQQKIPWIETERDFFNSLGSEIHNISKSSSKNVLNYEILKLLTDEMVKYKVTTVKELIAAKKGIKKDNKKIDYSKIFGFVYKWYDKFWLIDMNKEAMILAWHKLREDDRNKIFDLGYPVTPANIVNALFNSYDEETAKQMIKSITDISYDPILVDLRNKLIYKEITEKDYEGSDIGDRSCWSYIEKDKWYNFLFENLDKEKFNKLQSKIDNIYSDDNVKIRFVWAITEKLLGVEKTDQFFEDNNLVPNQNDDKRYGKIRRYILNIKGEKTEKQLEKEKENNDN